MVVVCLFGVFFLLHVLSSSAYFKLNLHFNAIDECIGILYSVCQKYKYFISITIDSSCLIKCYEYRTSPYKMFFLLMTISS